MTSGTEVLAYMSSMQRVMNGINVFSPLHVKMKRKIICREVNEKNVVLVFVVQISYYYSQFPYFFKRRLFVIGGTGGLAIFPA